MDRAIGVVRVPDVSLLGRGLDKLAGQMAGFGQEEETDLLHVGAGRHVDVVLRPVLMEAGALGVVVELRVDLLEIPRVLQVDDVEDHTRLGRDGVDVAFDPLRERRVLRIEDEVQLVDRKIVLLDESDVGAPGVPAARTVAAVGVLLGAENGDYSGFHGDILYQNPLLLNIRKDIEYLNGIISF